MIRPVRLVLFLLVVAEIASLAWLGKALGILGTIAVLIIAGFIGVSLIRSSGANLMKVVAGGSPSAQQLSTGAANSILQAIAGLLFILPGLVSDVVAILLLLPFTRNHVAGLFRFNTVVFESGMTGQAPPAAGPVIEGEAVEIIEPDKRLK